MGTELFFLSLLAYLLFGPREAARIAQKAGSVAAQVKRATRDLKEQMLRQAEPANFTSAEAAKDSVADPEVSISEGTHV